MLKDQARAMLEERLIPFWSALRDEKYGGFYGYMGFDLDLDRNAEKGCILNSRILWFFSRCAAQLGRADCLDHARHAFRFLMERCLDREQGGVFWSLNHDGSVLDSGKHTYAQSFAIYGLSAYYEASGDPEALDAARSLFRVVEDRCRDEGGYLEAFTRDFRPASNEKLSENGVMASRTMNTLLHVFEGYAGLYQAARDPEVGAAMERILDIYLSKIYDPEQSRQRVFFDLDYNSLIDLYSYGHDIESSWLMDWGTALLGKAGLTARVFQADQAMAGAILLHAFRDGSVLNECERGVDDTHRVWWVQAESVLGFLNAWEKTGQDRFRQAALAVWRYIQETLVDVRPGGEWFWRVDENGLPDREKPVVEPWKCPYHNGRMCLEILRRNWDVSC